MTGEVSTILVMGPQGSGKSEFIKRFAGTIKLKPNGSRADSLREISISPYFSDGETVKFVKFPGYNESGADPTDTKLFIGLATFLGVLRRRKEVIRSIIYIHPITNDGLNPANVKFDVEMLQEIAKDVMANVVIVTTKWDGIPDSSRDSMEADLRKGLMQFYQDPFMRLDGKKWSALSILDNAKEKTPILLDLKDENPSITSAGEVLTTRIDKLVESKGKEETDLRHKITSARKEKNKGKEDQLKKALAQVVATLLRLRSDRDELGGNIDWEQARRDNEALEGVIEERHDSATKDWKAEYEKLENESKAKAAESEKLLNAKAVEYNRLVNENRVLQTTVDKYHSNTYGSFPTRLRATSGHSGRDDGSFTVNEEVYCNISEPLSSAYDDSHLRRKKLEWLISRIR